MWCVVVLRCVFVFVLYVRTALAAARGGYAVGCCAWWCVVCVPVVCACGWLVSFVCWLLLRGVIW